MGTSTANGSLIPINPQVPTLANPTRALVTALTRHTNPVERVVAGLPGAMSNGVASSHVGLHAQEPAHPSLVKAPMMPIMCPMHRART